MLEAVDWRASMGFLSVVLAFAAFAVYAWQTISGKVRPHPLSWLLFGILSGTGYLIQYDQRAGAGSWALLTMAILCLFLSALSVFKGERRFSRQEWAFLAASLLIFIFTPPKSSRPPQRYLQRRLMPWRLGRRSTGAGSSRTRIA